LQGRTLEEYLLNVWLKDALKRARVTPEMEDSLVELFNRRRVYLLLDGVDEMTVGAYDNAPLQTIAKQLTTGWVSSARVVLTCRLNVWDAGKNQLERFDTYRTLEFSYGNAKKPDSDQVKQFISKWFEPSNPQLGKALRTALDQRGKERIKDLVKNPLRLALMCYSWQRRQGELPKTKATLYQRFVEVFYEWKQEYFPTTSATRQKLNQALGKLAVEAIAQSSSRFRLTRRFVCEVLGEPDAPLFQLAIQLGWLNQVGVAAENPDETVYAFYHPTFQEYFAALAIDDWHCFLNHVPNNPDLGIYRVFEPQWKEVILLWLGREDVPKQDKEEFIQALVNFEDGLRNFYWYRAYFLAAIAIAEFQDCSLADEIVGRLTHWISLSDFHEGGKIVILQSQTRDWERQVHDEIAKVALEVLKETEREKAIAAFVHLINTAYHSSTRNKAALNLWQIDPGNETALVKLIKTAANEEPDLPQPATEVLEQISTVSENAITAIVELIQTTLQVADCEWTYGAKLSIVRQVADLLGKFDPGNEAAITALVEKIQTDDDEWRRVAAECLEKVEPGNEIAITTLVKEIQIPEDESVRNQALLSISMNYMTHWEIEIGTKLEILNSYADKKRYLRAAESLGEIGRDNEKAIAALEQLVQTAQDEYLRSQALLRNRLEEASEIDKDNFHSLQELCLVAAKSLGTIDPGNKIALNALVQLIHQTQDEYLHNQALLINLLNLLNKTLNNDLQRDIRYIHKFKYRCQLAAASLGSIDPGNEIAISILVEVIHPSQHEYIQDDYNRIQAAKDLGIIDPGNEMAISALINVIQAQEDWEIVLEAFMSLGKAGINGIDKKTAIALLVELIETAEDEDMRIQAAKFLAWIDPGNETALSTLVELTKNIEDSYIRGKVAECLENIDPGNETAIATLIELSDPDEDVNCLDWEAFERLGRISMGNATAIAFLFDVFQTTQNEYAREEAAGNLRRILRGVRFPEVVTVLKNYLPLTDNVEPIENYCEEAIWHCAQNMSYPDFYQAWHGNPSSV
jgi:HEAT repeat protein